MHADGLRGRHSWFDDLARVTAGGMLATPRFWLVAVLAFAASLGPYGLPGAVALQVGCGALAGALAMQSFGRDPFANVPLFFLPGVVLLLHFFVTTESAYTRDRLGVPLLIVCGMLVAAVGTTGGKRVHRWLAPFLMAAGVLVVLFGRVGFALYQPGYRADRWIVLWSLGVATCMLAMAPPSDTDEGDAPTKAAGSSPWVRWFLFPAIVVALPVPGDTRLSIQIAAAFALAVFSGCVAAHVARGTGAEQRAAAASRLARCARELPWSASALIILAGIAVAWTNGHVRASLMLWTGVRDSPSYAPSASAASLAMSAPVAVLAHGPWRSHRRRGRFAPWFVALLLPGALVFVSVVPAVLIGGQRDWFLLEVGRSLMWGWPGMVLPLLAALVVPRCARVFGALEAALLFGAMALGPLSLAFFDAGGNFVFREESGWTTMARTYGVPVLAALFIHRMASCRISSRSLLRGGFVVAGLVALLSLIAFEPLAVRTYVDAPHGPFWVRGRDIAAFGGIATDWMVAFAALLAARLLASGGAVASPAGSSSAGSSSGGISIVTDESTAAS